MSAQLFGGFNEKDLMAVDYCETPQSGLRPIKRNYLPNEYGWMREYEVTIVIQCWQRDIKTVSDAIPTAPTSLTSTGGKNADGTTATRISWGADYVLQQVSPSKVSPSIAQLSILYRKSVPEAQDSYPSGLTIDCVAGVYSVVWQSVLFSTLDNGTGSCGSQGLEFVKRPEIRERYTVKRTAGGIWYERTEDRYYDVLAVRVDGVTAETHQIENRVVIVAPEVVVASGPAGDTRTDTETLTTSYPADLHWDADSDGGTCNLVWHDTAIWAMAN